MIVKIRVVLDTKEDIIRTIAIDNSKTLEDLHKIITNVFGFSGQHMASFYRTDDDWNQGEEIPLISMDESPNALSMATTTIQQNIEDEGEKLIYLYDFLNMWTFFVELVEVDVKIKKEELPKLVLSIGDVPEKAPEKEFKADRKSSNDPYGLDEFGDADGFGEFENLDDIDFDNY